MITVEIYPVDGPDRFMSSKNTYLGQVAVPRTGEQVYSGNLLYKVIDVTWVYGGLSGIDTTYPTRVVVKVSLAYRERGRHWWNRQPVQ